jgi:hypothetical protein
MKTYRGVEVQLHALLTSALHGRDWSASRPGSFTSRVRVPSTHCMEAGWAPDLSGRGGEEKTTSLPLPGIEPLSSHP